MPLRCGGGNASMTAAYSALPERLPFLPLVSNAWSLLYAHHCRCVPHITDGCRNVATISKKPTCAMYSHHEHNLFNRSAARPFRITHPRSPEAQTSRSRNGVSAKPNAKSSAILSTCRPTSPSQTTKLRCASIAEPISPSFSPSAWTARAHGGTTCLSNSSGAASNTRRCTCGPMTASARRTTRSADISTSITADVPIRVLTAARRSSLLHPAATPHGSLTSAEAPLIDAKNLFRQTGPSSLNRHSRPLNGKSEI